MDRKAALATYDEQVRRGANADGPGARVERAGEVVRYVSDDPEGEATVLWSKLDGASAGRAIAEQVEHFAALGRAFEWKHYAHDAPADLAARLRAAGFEPGGEETLMVAEAAAAVAAAEASVAGATGPGDEGGWPGALRVREARDEAGVDLVVRVHEEVFGVKHAWLRRALLARLERAPEAMSAFVATVGERAVCAGRVEFHRGTDFASLWGGGTLPAFRGRGAYRALVARRARLAAERGFRYLHVDASPASRPVLERLGFARLTTTTPYVWRPAEAPPPA